MLKITVTGARWQWIRCAISHIFTADAVDNSGNAIPLLSDIRDFFSTKGNPEFLLTRDLLVHLHSLEERTWKQLEKRTRHDAPRPRPRASPPAYP